MDVGHEIETGIKIDSKDFGMTNKKYADATFVGKQMFVGCRKLRFQFWKREI